MINFLSKFFGINIIDDKLIVKAEAYSSEGEELGKLGKYDSALHYFTKAIEICPFYAGAFINRGIAYLYLKEPHKAIADFNKAIELIPNFAEAYYSRGNANYDLKEYLKAIIDYNKAINLKPNFEMAYYNRGLSFYDLKEFNKAILDYTTAIELNCNKIEAYYNRGIAYNNLKEYSKAILDFTKTIEVNPNDYNAYNNRGLAYINLKEPSKAIFDYSRAIEIKPDFARAYYNRSIIYGVTGNNDKANEDIYKASSLGLKEAKDIIDKYYKSSIFDQNDECKFDKNEDGNTYKSVKIGAQIWTTKNLDVEHYRNGDVIPQVQDEEEWSELSTGAWCYYENKSENGETYGKLYNWYAVNDPRGLAPEGWHIPSDEEWTLLTDFLGGVTEENILEDGTKYLYIKSVGGQLKATELWDIPNLGATNSTEFKALPGGIRLPDGDFLFIDKFSYFWSSSEVNYDLAWGRYMNYGGSDVGCSHGYKVIGLSVRCVKD